MNWFNEKLVGVGFYVNPYHRYSDAKFKHIFAFDIENNFYIGQFSVYPNHIDEIFSYRLKEKKLEFGFIFPNLNLVTFDLIENKNITLLNKRLAIIAQRLYDYGMPTKTIIKSNQVDLGDPSLFNILKGKFLEKN